MAAIILIMMNDTFDIFIADWKTQNQAIREIRTRVFIIEQNVPEKLEWDEYDSICQHLLVRKNGTFIATSRLLDSGQIGRMAVLKQYRQQGVGTAMLTKLLEMAKSMKLDTVFLNAQLDAVDFYKKFGFHVQGELFNDAGIMHQRMSREWNENC